MQQPIKQMYNFPSSFFFFIIDASCLTSFLLFFFLITITIFIFLYLVFLCNYTLCISLSLLKIKAMTVVQKRNFSLFLGDY